MEIVFIPNQELVSMKDQKLLLKPNKIQHVLCKSIYSRKIFEKFKKQYNCKWNIESFIFPPVLRTRFFTKAKDRNVYFHPAGGSWMKHTNTVIEAWLQNPHWPLLIITCRGKCKEVHIKELSKAKTASNIKIHSLLKNTDMHTIQKHAGVVILPSACEGFGHSVYEAMENGNLLISADIPPLNENLIDGQNSLLIPTTSAEAIGDSKGKFKWSHDYSKYIGNSGSFCFDISVNGIEAAVERSLKLSSNEYYNIRLNALKKVHELVHDGYDSMRMAFSKIGFQITPSIGDLPSCFTSDHIERGERVVAAKFTNPDACVLEFGGGSGAVSTVIQQILLNKKNHVVVQPKSGTGDETPMFGGIDILQNNKYSCKSDFHIVDHILESGEGSKISSLVSKPFDTIVADCEGCLPGEYKKNPDLFKNVTMIQVERDDTQIYNSEDYEQFLNSLKFKKIHSGKGCGIRCATEVWVRQIYPERIFDCFMASTGEENLMLLRIATTFPYVYKYIIIDSQESHTGRRKPLVDLSVIPEHLRYKIVYENVIFPRSMKVEDPNIASDTSVAWAREGYQRDRIMFHLNNMANPNDLCYISDLDEIPYYDRILSKNLDIDKIVHYELPTYVFNIHFHEKDYLPHGAIGASYKCLSKALSMKDASLTSLRFEGLRAKNGGVKHLKHLKAKNIERGYCVHLNRFSSPLALLSKEISMVEARGQSKQENQLRRYFRIVCDCRDGKPIKGTHIRKITVNTPDVPPLIHQYLHPIHTMSPEDLKILHNYVKGLSDVELESFVREWF
jgi:hypothetical protein